MKSCQEETCARLSRKRGATMVPQTTERTTSRNGEPGQDGEKGGRSSVLAGPDVFNFGVGTAPVKNKGSYSIAATTWRLPMSCGLRGPSNRQEGSSVPRDRDSCPCPRLMRFWTNFSKKFLWRGASSILSPACCTAVSVDFPDAV